MARRLLLSTGAVVAFLLAWGAYRLFIQGIVLRFPKSGASGASFAREIDDLSRQATAGPAISDDRRFLAFTTAAARSFHTVAVWDSWSEKVTPVVSIQEIDPGSGLSYSYAWSSGPRALLISGTGRLPFQKPGKVCLAYLPTDEVLYRVSPCS